MATAKTPRAKTASAKERPIALQAFVSKFTNGHGFNLRLPFDTLEVLREAGVVAVQERAHDTALIKFESRSADGLKTYKVQIKRGGQYGIIRVGERNFLAVAGDWLQNQETGSTEVLLHFYPTSRDILVYEPVEVKPVDR